MLVVPPLVLSLKVKAFLAAIPPSMLDPNKLILGVAAATGAITVAGVLT
jgi:hypothetical protein